MVWLVLPKNAFQSLLADLRLEAPVWVQKLSGSRPMGANGDKPGAEDGTG